MIVRRKRGSPDRTARPGDEEFCLTQSQFLATICTDEKAKGSSWRVCPQPSSSSRPFGPGADHIPEAIGFRISTARLLPQALCFKLRVRQRSCFFHASGRKAMGMYMARVGTESAPVSIVSRGSTHACRDDQCSMKHACGGRGYE